MSIRELEKAFINELSGLYEFEEARNLAWLSVGHICKVTRIQYLGIKENQLSASQQSSLNDVLDELKTGKPIQYILGDTDFYGLTFKVNGSVLIPRPETEELVDWIIKDIKHERSNLSQFNILDIGTGSGCIPISLKSILSAATISAFDISFEAINTSRANSILNDTKINFFQDDLFNMVQPELLNGSFDVIVSNPPYVTAKEKASMHQNVLDFEPHLALFVSDDDPLKFYKSIAAYGQRHLAPNGKLYLEINEDLGEETVEMLRDNFYKNVKLRSDLRNKNRMIRAEKQ